MTMIPGVLSNVIKKASEKHQLKDGIKIQYGTAGFRTKAADLDSTLFRVGILAALRSKCLGGKTVGVMVTASHNPEEDNGVKIVDPRGEMLLSSWESYATLLANSSSSTGLIQELSSIVYKLQIDLSISASVVTGHDTRPSCESLMKSLNDGLGVFSKESLESEEGVVGIGKVEVIEGGLKTTPQLHYLVRCLNESREVKEGKRKSEDVYGDPTEEGYYQKLSKAWRDVIIVNSDSSSTTTITSPTSPSPSPVYVDCANGVGAPKLSQLIPHLQTHSPNFQINILNDSIKTPGALNNDCGADYVKTRQSAPPSLIEKGILTTKSGDDDRRYCSFDGDADRIVYYYLSEKKDGNGEGEFRLLDGDKIAVLATQYIIELVRQSGLDQKLKVGVVQTAYANGSSTKYLKEVLKVPITCVSTGVKYLHHAAESYDIGVYFEANGHGTVLFSPTALSHIQSAVDSNTSSSSSSSPSSSSSYSAVKRLKALTELINQTVGDAISDFLLVESILLTSPQTNSPKSWDSSYQDYPNRLLKVLVKDRNKFETEDAERKLNKPEGLQSLIDGLVGKFEGGRSFVRPSGTEDCVRVYAEAKKREDADELAFRVAGIVFDGYGKGDKPKEFY